MATEARELGYAAYQAGTPICECPYEPRDYRFNHWCKAWRAAAEHAGLGLIETCKTQTSTTGQ